MSAQVTHITIKIGEEEKVLTLEQAKELQASLNDLLQASMLPRYAPVPYPTPVYPVWGQTFTALPVTYAQPTTLPPWTVMCGGAQTTTTNRSNQANYQCQLDSYLQGRDIGAAGGSLLARDIN